MLPIDTSTISFFTLIQHCDEFWDYEFMDENLNNSYLVTYDESIDKWHGVKEVINAEHIWVPAGDLTPTQVNHCRTMIPDTLLPIIQE